MRLIATSIPKETAMNSSMQIHNAWFRTLCRILMLTVALLSFQTAQAGMLGAGQIDPSTASSERTMVQQMLQRGDVIRELQSAGVDPKAAQDRAATMSDDEIHALAGKLNTLPAGGDGWFVALILVVFFIWYFAFRR